MSLYQEIWESTPFPTIQENNTRQLNQDSARPQTCWHSDLSLPIVNWRNKQMTIPKWLYLSQLVHTLLLQLSYNTVTISVSQYGSQGDGSGEMLLSNADAETGRQDNLYWEVIGLILCHALFEETAVTCPLSFSARPSFCAFSELFPCFLPNLFLPCQPPDPYLSTYACRNRYGM